MGEKTLCKRNTVKFAKGLVVNPSMMTVHCTDIQIFTCRQPRYTALRERLSGNCKFNAFPSWT